MVPHLGVKYTGPAFNQCNLKNPLTEDTDMVPDTPIDPGENSYCSTECPIATTPCTLACDQSGGMVTYTYVDYLTNNLMSDHICTPKTLTGGQKDLMNITLNTSIIMIRSTLR